MDRSAESSKIRPSTSKNIKKDQENLNEAHTQTEIQPMHGVDLNDDCLLKIFGYLDLSDLVHVAAACKRFYFVARYVFAQTFAKDVVTVTNEYTTAGELPSVAFLSQFGDLITKLKVDYIPHRSFDYVLEETISKYCRKNLIEVEFQNGSDCIDFAFDRIERPFEAVNRVLFSSCQMVSLIFKFDKLFPKATSLDLIDSLKYTTCVQLESRFPSQLDHLGQSYPSQLDHLRIIQPYCTTHVDGSVLAFMRATINSNPQLKSLTFKCGRKWLTSEDLSYINEKLPLLETLNTQIGSSTSEKQIHFQNLRQLTIACSESKYLSGFRITTRLPVELTLIGRRLSSRLAGFFSTNQNWNQISLHGFWRSYEYYEEFKNEITKLKLLTRVEMSASGLQGEESGALALLDQCKSLKKLKLYSADIFGFGALMKFIKATEYRRDSKLELQAKLHAERYGDMLVTSSSYDDNALEFYRREFESKYKESAWVPKFEAKKIVEGRYRWTEYSAAFQSLNGQ